VQWRIVVPKECRVGTHFWRGIGAPVVVAATLLTLAASTQAESPAAPAASAPAIKRTVLGRTEVAGASQEVVYVLVEVPAHTEVPRHTHPGTVFGYLLEGDYTMMIEGQPARSLQAGEWLQVPSGVPHAERAGDRPARLLAIFTVEKGRPLTTPAP
jgi:quercetin dioxygenase-like cupin family protein